ncbi:hypothetical protein SLEP1_g17470 [Rubroshorea leprosula]|uniref:Uncharacterized protein n=1 Tax=Rubroshorea leprosula TaxID=152421 RepID=A0AAV5J3G8_9ROSI|nr:hypothetical protein SLEP1_g17470 [Rubroshorea leprosula]
MYTRLNDIVTNLKALGKVYPSQEVLEDLIGKLMTYEIEVQVDGGVEVVEKKKKDVAFKASNQKEKSEDDASDGENISTLISREMGHYRNECPKLKKGEKKGKKSMKKKAFATTWSHDETSSTESESSLEKGVANLCFMAQEDSNHDEEGKSKRKQIGSSSAGGQTQEEGNLVDNALFVDDDAINHYNVVKNLAVLPCNNWKRLNLDRFIYHNIIKNYSLDMGFPHGALITRLVKRNNIDLESFKHGKIKAGTTLTQASFEKMQIVFQNGDCRKRGDQAMGQQSDEEEGDAD